LADFAGGQRGAALGPPPEDLVVLVEQPLIEEALEGPPDALDVRLVEGDVGVVEVHPERDAPGHVAPGVDVPEDRVDALPRERFDAVRFDGLASVNAELFFDLDLDREAVGIPACAPGHVVAAHGAIAEEDVLHHPGEHVARMGHAVGRRGAFVEDEALAFGVLLGARLEDGVLVPEIEPLLIEFGEGDLRCNGVEHGTRLLARTRDPGPGVAAAYAPAVDLRVPRA